MKGIKAVAFDIDGTLTDARRRLVLEAVEAVRQLEERGVVCLLVSGNVLPVAYGIGSALGISGPIVGENGGIVYHNGKVYLLVDRTEVMAAYKKLKERMDVRPLVTNRWREAEVGIYPDVPIDEVKDALRGFNVTAESTGFAHHIYPKGTDKSTGLKYALELIGVTPEESISFGDYYTDIPMMKLTRFSGAPAQAPEEVKKVATWVSSREYGYGTAELIREHLL